MLHLPQDLQALLAPLFEAWPLDRAILGTTLEDADEVPQQALDMVEALVTVPELADKPALRAGLLFYVDCLEDAMEEAEEVLTPSGAFWRAMIFRREGKFGQAKLSARQVGHHPVLDHMEMTGGGAAAGTEGWHYTPEGLVARIAEIEEKAESLPADLIALQHREFKALFEYCAESAGT